MVPVRELGQGAQNLPPPPKVLGALADWIAFHLAGAYRVVEEHKLETKEGLLKLRVETPEKRARPMLSRSWASPLSYT